MLIVSIPNNNLYERRYILDIIFNQFLGIEYNVEIDYKSSFWKIQLNNNKFIIVQDHFFSKFTENLQYLDISNLPRHVEFEQNPFTSEIDIPVIYGVSNIEIQENHINCGIDIFASCFFMLTRWEEYVNKIRDIHERFPASVSIAHKFCFLNRPVVDEYTYMLKNMLIYFDKNLIFKQHVAKTTITCDVDQPFDYTVRNFFTLTRACIGDLLKRMDFNEFYYRILRYIFNKFSNFKYDKYYNIFSWYMNICKNKHLKLIFFFIADNDNNKKLNGYYSLNDKHIQNLLYCISSRGFEIGMHGSYYNYTDICKIKKEKNIFEIYLNTMGIKNLIKGNRQHYLRFDVSLTPAMLENAGFEFDTSGSYADIAGFRFGTSHKFSMFDFLNRTMLNIFQVPLIVMDCTIFSDRYMSLNYTDGLNIINDFKQKCYKYKGNFVLLWHNSELVTEKQKKLFLSIIS